MSNDAAVDLEIFKQQARDIAQQNGVDLLYAYVRSGKQPELAWHLAHLDDGKLDRVWRAADNDPEAMAYLAAGTSREGGCALAAAVLDAVKGEVKESADAAAAVRDALRAARACDKAGLRAAVKAAKGHPIEALLELVAELADANARVRGTSAAAIVKLLRGTKTQLRKLLAEDVPTPDFAALVAVDWRAPAVEGKPLPKVKAPPGKMPSNVVGYGVRYGEHARGLQRIGSRPEEFYGVFHGRSGVEQVKPATATEGPTFTWNEFPKSK